MTTTLLEALKKSPYLRESEWTMGTTEHHAHWLAYKHPLEGWKLVSPAYLEEALTSYQDVDPLDYPRHIAGHNRHSIPAVSLACLAMTAYMEQQQ